MPADYRHKIICDPVHREIPVSQIEKELIDSPSFQRLRNLKQLGLGSLVYPNATHTRFAHSLGVFRIMSRVIDLLVERGHFGEGEKRVMRIAALLHDVGHYPYSHLMEYVDRDKHRPAYLRSVQASGAGSTPATPYPDHEKVGEIIITQRDDISQTLRRYGIDPAEVAAIIRSEHQTPAFNRLMHSSLDMDRMDYLLRDSLGTGVPYGQIDLDYLLNNLEVVAENGVLDVVVSHKAATAAEHFLIARYFMHKAVYFHKTTFGLEAMLRQILFLMREAGQVYRDGGAVESIIPTDEFLSFHDGYVDGLVQRQAQLTDNAPLTLLCRALKQREPPRLVHQVGCLQQGGQHPTPEYALFTKDRVPRIRQLAERYGISVERWIWEDPKDIRFESMGPSVSLAEASELDQEEMAELIRVKEANGAVRKLVEDQRSILHHLSDLRFRMSRLYVAGPVDPNVLRTVKAEVQEWCRLN